MPNYWKYNKSMIDFFPTEHISSSCKRKFGICDRPAPAAEKAYIAEKQGQDWIAAVDNHYRLKVNAERKSKVDDNTAKMQSIKWLGV